MQTSSPGWMVTRARTSTLRSACCGGDKDWLVNHRATLASDDELNCDLDWLGVGEARVVDVGEDWVESHEAAALVRVEAEAVDQ